MIYATADLHLKPETADTVFEVLRTIAEEAESGWPDRAQLAIVGDLYCERYSVPVALQNRLLDELHSLLKIFDNVLILPGNHDQDTAHGRHALEVFDGLQGPRGRVHCFTEPTENEWGCWLPYRKDPSELVAFAQKSKSKVAWLHHGIVGAMMNTHVVAGPRDGIDPADLANFDVVYAGHWHRHQQVRNVVYCGSPWQTASDEAGQDKVFLRTYGTEWGVSPIDVGPKHFRVRLTEYTPLPLEASTGDHVHVVLDDSAHPDALAIYKATLGDGVRVTCPPPPPKEKKRLNVGAVSPHEVTTAYVEEYAQDRDPKALLELFRGEIAC